MTAPPQPPAEDAPASAPNSVSARPPSVRGAAEQNGPAAGQNEPAADGSEAASPGMTVLHYGDKTLYLVGTAHVSQRSVEEVRRVIDQVKPDSVCVELDATRLEALTDPSRFRKLDIFQVIRQRKLLFLVASLALSSYQRKLGAKLGVRPGAEMLEAVQLARASGAELVLADRDVQATLKRTWAALRLGDRAQLLSVMVASMFSREEISEEQVEALKDRDTIGDMLKEFARAMPRVKGPLIDERDSYLISRIRSAPGPRVVGVVGAAHVEGMVARLQEEVDHDALSAIPPPSRLAKALPWVVPLLVLAAFYFGYRQHRGEGLQDMLFAWVLPNSLFGAAGALAALATPLTVGVAFVASPITSLNPTVGAGMVAALCEAWLRRPTVADCEGLAEVSTLKDWYANRFTRVLLVCLGVTLGSALGAWVGFAWVARLAQVFWR